MSLSKAERALHGPSWFEIIFGAALSVVLGVVLAATYLVLKPVISVKTMPKEPVAGAIYFIEGSKDTSKGKTWLRKRQALLEGQSVVLSEDELNTILVTPTEKPKGGAGQPAPTAANPAPASDALLVPGPINFRIADGMLQIGLPVKVSLFDASVVIQAAGGFVKKGETFCFEPKSFYVGSCPVHRLPMVAGFVTKRLLAAQSIPSELDSAWKKLADVTVEPKVLKLAMP
ncbi:MAG: hypothetical protein HZA31_13250 [Opitutae bacterium]|nr:hypothetical protein [Opitutae bacterium]